MLNFNEQLDKEKPRIKSMEQILGKELNMPFANTVSGARKVLYSVQSEQVMPLFDPEPPIISTGYENKYGKFSSSIIQLDDDYTVEARINMYEDYPDHHYFLFLRSKDNKLKMIERVFYKYNTESYGYIYNNEILDKIKVGQQLKQGEVLRRSSAYDKYGNRSDGVNLLVTYLNTSDTMEDCITLSDVAARKLSSPLVKTVTIMKNDNDVMLNLFGNDIIHQAFPNIGENFNDILCGANTPDGVYVDRLVTEEEYKSFPNLGEDVPSGILCALRREKIEEALFTLSMPNLKRMFISDTKYTVEGTIADIKVYCNNPDSLNSASDVQLLRYYNDRMRFNKEFVNVVDHLISTYNITESDMDYQLQKMYVNTKKELNKGVFVENNKAYSGCIIEFTLVERSIPKVGDKFTNRCGGKGVITIRPQYLMPKLDDGRYIDMIYNGSTCVNRLNKEQLNEMSLNFYSARIMEFIRTNVLFADEAWNIILKYMDIVSPNQANDLYKTLSTLDENERQMFLDNIKGDDFIRLCNKPITETITNDDLAKILEEFPWIQQYKMSIPIVNSNGNIDYIESSRRVTAGYIYIYRLKQYAEDKFSATSLSAINLSGKNTKTKQSKKHQSLYQCTPIKFGEMEAGEFSHMAIDKVMDMFMIHSFSPKGRRLAQLILTAPDPYNIDIQLDSDTSNRNVEHLNQYLKVMGYKLEFIKKYKKGIKPFKKFDKDEKRTKPYHKVYPTVDKEGRIIPFRRVDKDYKPKKGKPYHKVD